MDAQQFEKLTGRKPIDDDLDRVNCPIVGEIGHSRCGWCEKCKGPRFECNCSMGE